MGFARRSQSRDLAIVYFPEMLRMKGVAPLRELRGIGIDRGVVGGDNERTVSKWNFLFGGLVFNTLRSSSRCCGMRVGLSAVIGQWIVRRVHVSD